MNIEDKEFFIRQKVQEHISETNEKIFWSLHAVEKLRLEGVRKKEIEDSLKECIIIEDYPEKGRPLPSCLALGFIGSHPVHSVIGVDRDSDRIYIITVYKPSRERWEDGWKERKK